MSFTSLYNQRKGSLWCKKIKLLWNSSEISPKVTWIQSNRMYRSSSKLKREQRLFFVIRKVYSFLLRKSTLIRILQKKKQCEAVSVVAKCGGK